MSRHSTLGLALAFASFALACGGGQESHPPSSNSGNTPAPAAGAPQPVNRCPITAEQVSAALGTTVQRPDATVCMFAPGSDLTALPNVTFVRQVAFACNGTMPAEVGYKDQVQGLGVTAHISDTSSRLELLVCQGQTPFELTVEAKTSQLRRDAAIALAKQVLAAS